MTTPYKTLLEAARKAVFLIDVQHADSDHFVCEALCRGECNCDAAENIKARDELLAAIAACDVSDSIPNGC